MTRMGLIAGMVLLSLPLVARADDLPRYDMDAFCRGVASVAETTSDDVLAKCLDREHEAYDVAKSKWPSLPASAQSFCERSTLAAGDGSYEKLRSCIEQKEAGGSPSFRY